LLPAILEGRSIAVRHGTAQMVKRRRSTEHLERLRRRITRLDGHSIDELYGLEPLWEPGTAPAGMPPEEFVAVRCPYCGERLQTRVDLTADEPCYVEDCEVCCRPIEFHIERDAGGALLALQVRRLD
jgi:hypothetical protein